ncbi:MAG: orotidine-5'-phosphate decarboxylase [Neisseriaceae bacterium]|nr:orotidine-5'-phosphate decarboxylase [Neisseriaceae bacterium]MBP6861581.1 orotidine-5'-phosphate decarboxylase [Neisseriaceae bacterium]
MNPLMMNDSSTNNQRTPVIVALDFDNAAATLNFARQLNPDLCQLKIGKELFTATGRSLSEQLIQQGFKLFLDLKYHDIPNTVAQACKVAAQMGVWMVDVHTLGGRRMMEAAAEAVANEAHKPLLIGVTVLTSMEASDLAEVGISVPADEMVLRLAGLAKSSGLDGVVCSAQEASMLKQNVNDCLLVTPGIRMSLDINDDQRRVMTPEMALQAGSDYLVMGRPVTQAADPIAVLNQVNALANPV